MNNLYLIRIILKCVNSDFYWKILISYILSNKIMKALDDHPTPKGKFNREDPMFKYRAADADAHKGYQQWHRDIDNSVVDWLQNNLDVTEQQFTYLLNKLYHDPDISKRAPNVSITRM